MRQRCGVTGNFGSTSRKLQAIAAASPSETGERGRLRFATARAAAPLPFFVASCGKVSLARRMSEAKVKDLFGVALIFQKRSVVCAPFFVCDNCRKKLAFAANCRKTNLLLRLIAEKKTCFCDNCRKKTCFCGLKIVILPFCPKACGSLLPAALLTCAKKRVISENCPYSGRYSTKSSASFCVNSIKTSMGSVCFLSTRSSNISAIFPFCSAENCCVCSTTISSGLK